MHCDQTKDIVVEPEIIHNFYFFRLTNNSTDKENSGPEISRSLKMATSAITHLKKLCRHRHTFVTLWNSH